MRGLTGRGIVTRGVFNLDTTWHEGSKIEGFSLQRVIPLVQGIQASKLQCSGLYLSSAVYMYSCQAAPLLAERIIINIREPMRKRGIREDGVLGCRTL